MIMAHSPWFNPKEEMPPLHLGVLIELRDGPMPVCDVACYAGKYQLPEGGTEDRWILADIRLDTKQIKRWSYIHTEQELMEGICRFTSISENLGELQ